MPDGQPNLVPPPELRCRFVKTNGARCTTPALHNQDLCFDHTYRVRVVRGQAKRIRREEPWKVPLIDYHWVEEHHAILRNLNEVSQQLANGAITFREAHAFILLQRTMLKTLRQMKEIQELEQPVREYVEEDGVALSVPDKDAAGQPIDRTADPDHPNLSFDPNTDEGRKNQEQKFLWEYFSADPASGIRSGLDINWPGRPADFVPPQTPSPATSAPSQPNSAADLLVAQPAPETDHGVCLALQAVAHSARATPSESVAILSNSHVTSLVSTHTPNSPHNSCRSHTYTNRRKISRSRFRAKASAAPSACRVKIERHDRTETTQTA